MLINTMYELNAGHRSFVCSKVDMITALLLLALTSRVTVSTPAPITTPQNAPGPVRNLRLLVPAPDRILVTWSEPLVRHGGIAYYDLQVSANGIPLRDRMARETTDTHYVLHGLRPYTNYRVTVRAHTTLPGEAVSEEARTKQSEPEGPPTNIRVYRRTSESLSFAWDQPEERLRNGIITRYEYVFFNKDDGMHYIVRSTRSTTATITDLLPDTSYSFKIKSYTEVGSGPFSDEVAGQTLADGEIVTTTDTTTDTETTTALLPISPSSTHVLKVNTPVLKVNTPVKEVSTKKQSTAYTMSTTQRSTTPIKAKDTTAEKYLPTIKPTTMAAGNASHHELRGRSPVSTSVVVLATVCGVVFLLSCIVCVLVIRHRSKRRAKSLIEPVRLTFHPHHNVPNASTYANMP